MFEKMNIEKKLFWGFGVGVIAISIVTFISIICFISIKGRLDLIIEDRFPKTVWTNEIIHELNYQARAIRNMIIMENKDDIAKEFEGIKESRKKIAETLENLDKKITSTRGIELLKKLKTSRSDYLPLMDEVIKLANENKKNEARDILLAKVRPAQLKYMKDLDDIISYQVELMNEAGQAAELLFKYALIALILITMVIGYVSYRLGKTITKQITIPLSEVTNIAGILAKGATANVAKEFLARDDEIGVLAKAFDKLVESTKGKILIAQTIASGDISKKVQLMSDQDALGIALTEMSSKLNSFMRECNTASSQVFSGASQVASASQTLSQGATEQASSLEEITSSMNEVGGQTKKNAENAKEASLLASEAKNTAVSGNGQMKKMIDAMNGINTSSDNIAKIIKVIDEIAFQTNLLALNAAVEAARAGKHGKGFAVVAEEVRNLAARSAQAAKETTAMIDDSTKKVKEGSAITESTAQALEQIVVGATKVTDIINEIAAASNEQAQGISQIVIALSQIDQVTQRNTASAEESAAAAEELSSQSNELRKLVGNFQLAL